MLRLTWPLALFVAVVIVVVARRPRLILPVLVVFAVWFVVQTAMRRRR
jgi:hypothetical protein